jgi:hypothetical protein
MERNFTNENFERFLRQNADSLRMRPNEKVWKEISSRLTRTRRRYTIVVSVLLLISSGLGYEWFHDVSVKHHSIGSISPAREVTTSKENIVSSTTNSNRFITYSSPIQKSEQAYTAFIKKELVSLKPEPVNHTSNSSSSNEFIAEPVDSYPADEVKKLEVTGLANLNRSVTPLSIESVVNLYKGQLKKKINWEIYFTPTVSYRKLSDNKSFSNGSLANLSSYPQLYNINNAVTHKPDFGFELGLTGKYPLSANLKLRAGLQFNVNRYDIKVFNAPNQLATIRLNSRYAPDSLNAITTYSNQSGYRTDWLQNFYFQISAPVGLEFKIRGDDKMQFGIATTVQPTYLLGDRVYLISTDYKNYAQVPWLVRRWNINSSFETFVSYSTGHLKWQVGPQFRYQLLSSFIDKYPVKENLYNFGLKVGISLNQ